MPPLVGANSGASLEPQPIFITGATGFLGRHLVEHLLRRGRKLRLVVRNMGRCPPAWRDRPEISILELGELGPDTDFGETLQGIDTIVHLAGLAHVAVEDWAHDDAAFMKANSGITAALAAAARKASVRSFVHLSTLAAITPNVIEQTIDDSTDLGASTAYGRSKRKAEAHVHQLAEHGVFAVSLRPPLVIGADAKGNWALFQKIAATGLPLPFASVRNQRSFIGVDALCEAIALLAEKPWLATLSGEYCIADCEPLSLPEVTRLLRTGMDKAPRLFPFPPTGIGLLGTVTGRRRQFASLTGGLKVDPSRFNQTFSFKPSSSLDKAILRSGADYMRNRMREGGEPNQ